jgi:hypothetical protein
LVHDALTSCDGFDDPRSLNLRCERWFPSQRLCDPISTQFQSFHGNWFLRFAVFERWIRIDQLSRLFVIMATGNNETILIWRTCYRTSLEPNRCHDELSKKRRHRIRDQRHTITIWLVRDRMNCQHIWEFTVNHICNHSLLDLAQSWTIRAWGIVMQIDAKSTLLRCYIKNRKFAAKICEFDRPSASVSFAASSRFLHGPSASRTARYMLRQIPNTLTTVSIKSTHSVSREGFEVDYDLWRRSMVITDWKLGELFNDGIWQDERVKIKW